ncbi:helix-turn-helix domain-containing protein [Zafaria sp. Z1313]|uniref:helix-turn-helix domain-containing protein n=1 Tax=unclassified Zafaria TaxID=2828765 RepID=UPI002E77795A|nr:helix-turn-helix domain-containing protein [Zafaria sp. J156]MEE1620968.1 helix-turn-helix domain-containing protein [Zafaria sp. J156]
MDGHNKELDRRWDALLDRLSVDALTEAFLERVLGLSDYSEALLPVAEIRRTGTGSFAALIESLRPDPDSARLSEVLAGIAADVGVSRARAGIPVESLMTAIRLDFSVLWGALTAIAGPGDAPLLVGRADLVWDVVDSYASQTQGVYMAERTRMAQEESSVKQGLVAALFGPSLAPPGQLERVADGLGLDPDAALAVAVAAGEDAAGLRVALALAARRGLEVFTHPFADALAAFWVPGPGRGAAGQEALERVLGLRCGLVPSVEGLAGLWSAARLARELALLTTPDDTAALTPFTAWARLARVRLGEAGLGADSDVVLALAGCGEVERVRLREAVGAYLETGSVSASAVRLFCHRNTLMNRLRRFTELTGIDPTIPRDAARLVVAWS